MILLFPLSAAGQSLPMTRSVYGVDAICWRSPAKAASQEMPSSVDNSTTIHFPPIFNQIGGSCAQASSIGYMFTYEMNALLDRDASLPENRFSYLYTWNLINGGKDEGSFQFDGLQLSTENGLITEKDFPKQTGPYSFKWASGFDKYLNAMHYKVDEFVNLEITDSLSLTEIKQYLWNKGIEGGKGGVLTFSSQATGWEFDTEYSGPSETGYNCLLTKLAYDGAHAMTIVGYDDTVEFTRPDGKTSKGAFIAVNSYGENFWYHDRGRYYLPYWFFLQDFPKTELSKDLLGIIPKYVEHPDIVFKVALDYTSRNDLSFRYGVSEDCNAMTPKYDLPFALFDHQGGDYAMQGNGGLTYFEFGMDFSKILIQVKDLTNPNWFLTVTRADRGSKYGQGVMKTFEVYDYREDAANPKVYVHESIDETPIENGKNIFNIPSIPPDRCSYSTIVWLNKTGQPIASPYVIRTADGKYAKVRFSDYDRENGTIKIKYVYAPSGSTNVE